MFPPSFNGPNNPSSGGWKLEIFTSSGTWVCPYPNCPVFVLAVGGGSSANATGATPANNSGGSSSFGALVTAAGGVFNTSGYHVGAVGNPGGNGMYTAGESGKGFLGIGSGGTGRGSNGDGGGASGAISTYTGNVSLNQTVTVGLGGGSPAGNCNAGATGSVLVWSKQ